MLHAHKHTCIHLIIITVIFFLEIYYIDRKGGEDVCQQYSCRVSWNVIIIIHHV